MSLSTTTTTEYAQLSFLPECTQLPFLPAAELPYPSSSPYSEDELEEMLLAIMDEEHPSGTGMDTNDELYGEYLMENY
eukprot:194106-Hanusia_phi.AAC.1